MIKTIQMMSLAAVMMGLLSVSVSPTLAAEQRTLYSGEMVEVLGLGAFQNAEGTGYPGVVMTVTYNGDGADPSEFIPFADDLFEVFALPYAMQFGVNLATIKLQTESGGFFRGPQSTDVVYILDQSGGNPEAWQRLTHAEIPAGDSVYGANAPQETIQLENGDQVQVRGWTPGYIQDVPGRVAMVRLIADDSYDPNSNRAIGLGFRVYNQHLRHQLPAANVDLVHLSVSNDPEEHRFTVQRGMSATVEPDKDGTWSELEIPPEYE